MSMLVPDITIAEKVMRSARVYRFLLVAFHVAVKRPMGQLAALDLVVLLGITAMSEVRYAFLEKAGHVSALPRRFVPA
jgi:uncharacterized membrane protein YcaP (DUF421 family)